MSSTGIFGQLLSGGDIAFPKFDCTLTLKQQPDGKYAVLLDGVELPITACHVFVPPSQSVHELLDGRSVFRYLGGLQPGTLGITLMFNKLEVINGQSPPPEEPHPHHRAGLDL